MRKKGKFRKADQIKKKYLNKLKTKKDIQKLEDAWNEYLKSEQITDEFAKETLGFKEEIEAMRKVSEELKLSLEFSKKELKLI